MRFDSHNRDTSGGKCYQCGSVRAPYTRTRTSHLHRDTLYDPPVHVLRRFCAQCNPVYTPDDTCKVTLYNVSKRCTRRASIGKLACSQCEKTVKNVMQNTCARYGIALD